MKDNVELNNITNSVEDIIDPEIANFKRIFLEAEKDYLLELRIINN